MRSSLLSIAMLASIIGHAQNVPALDSIVSGEVNIARNGKALLTIKQGWVIVAVYDVGNDSLSIESDGLPAIYGKNGLILLETNESNGRMLRAGRYRLKGGSLFVKASRKIGGINWVELTVVKLLPGLFIYDTPEPSGAHTRHVCRPWID